MGWILKRKIMNFNYFTWSKHWHSGPPSTALKYLCCNTEAVDHRASCEAQDLILTPLLHSSLLSCLSSLEPVTFTRLCEALHISCAVLLFFQFVLEMSSKPFWNSATAPALESDAHLMRADIIQRKAVHVEAVIRNAILPATELIRQHRHYLSTLQL